MLEDSNEKDKKILQKKYQYSLDDKLGSGSFAEVYKGIHLETKEILAIKVIRKAGLKKYGDEIMKAIGSEVDILQKISFSISTPFIVKIFDCFGTENNIYMVLEFCDQGTLYDILKKKKTLSEEEAIPIIYQVVSAVDILARNGIAHRDIKPENIFVKDNVFKLGDFGFAQQKTLFGTTLGTYPYMAPEIFKDSEYDNKVDTWAISVMLHEILFGELYFIGKTHVEVAENIMKKPYQIKDKSKVSKECQDFLFKGLEKDPKKRLSAAEMKQHPVFNNLRSMFQSSKPPQNHMDIEEVHDEEASVQRIKSSFKQIKLSKEEEMLLEELMNYRNGALLLIEVGEILVDFVEDCRFCIFFLLKKAFKNMHYVCSEMSNRKLPALILKPEKYDSLWKSFISKDPIYKNLINRFNEDYQAIKIQYQVYLEEIGQFTKKNFPEKATFLSQILNLDLLSEFEPLFVKETEVKSELFKNKGSVEKGNSARQLYLISYMLFLSSNIDTVSLNSRFNFELFNEKKDSWDENRLRQLISKKSFDL